MISNMFYVIRGPNACLALVPTITLRGASPIDLRVPATRTHIPQTKSKVTTVAVQVFIAGLCQTMLKCKENRWLLSKER